ncbi:CPBP family intramembrane glutamic endopeptidase [Xanthomonas maliensis]|uniref:CPBP family intramembrane glutamic endopeptidase n=1 Tax=Xanthomonas maliensis TaxID=1321368 RepID=UPI00039D3115|nr:CPBP family intramembrane glutamic endopeptidase [Xanthomonas maliensis]
MSVQILIAGMAWLPWIVLFPATVLLWRDRTRTLGVWAVGVGYALAALVGQLSAPFVFSLAALLVAGCAVMRGRTRGVRIAGHVLFVLTAIALRRHIAPGFDNPLALSGVVSAGAVPYKAYLNLDKTLSAVWVVAAIAWLDTAGPTLRRLGRGALIGLASCVVVAMLALSAGVVRVEPKLPAMTWLWALNNVLLVCFAEEVFFRGYLQGGLARLLAGRRGGDWMAIVAAALVFGVAHADQGPAMLLLSAIAGVGYGIAYRRAGLVGAIAAHAMLNVVHFLLLTYPALA